MRVFSLRQEKSGRKWWQFFLIAAPVCGLLYFAMPRGSLAIVASGGVAAVLALVFLIADRRRQVRIELTETALIVRGDLYGSTWPYAGFALEDARFVDIATEPEWRPKWKVWGTSMWGYQSGSFRLQNRVSATVFLSDLEKVLLVPFRSGSVLMLSVGEEFLVALREVSSEADAR